MMKLLWFVLCEVLKHVAVQAVIPVALAVVCCAGQCLLAARCWHPADLVLPAGTGLALRVVTYCGDHMSNVPFDTMACQLWVCGAFYGTMVGWAVGYLMKQAEKGSSERNQ